jgi:hypothetical protein
MPVAFCLSFIAAFQARQQFGLHVRLNPLAEPQYCFRSTLTILSRRPTGFILALLSLSHNSNALFCLQIISPLRLVLHRQTPSQSSSNPSDRPLQIQLKHLCACQCPLELWTHRPKLAVLGPRENRGPGERIFQFSGLIFGVRLREKLRGCVRLSNCGEILAD